MSLLKRIIDADISGWDLRRVAAERARVQEKCAYCGRSDCWGARDQLKVWASVRR